MHAALILNLSSLCVSIYRCHRMNAVRSMQEEENDYYGEKGRRHHLCTNFRTHYDVRKRERERERERETSFLGERGQGGDPLQIVDTKDELKKNLLSSSGAEKKRVCRESVEIGTLGRDQQRIMKSHRNIMRGTEFNRIGSRQ